MPQSGMTAPPRGEPRARASVSIKFVVRQGRKKVRLTTNFLFIYGRTLGSPCGRAGERSETERGASPACGRGAAAGGGEGKNGEQKIKRIKIQNILSRLRRETEREVSK